MNQPQWARLLYNIKLEMFASDKRSNLGDLLVSYEENGVLWNSTWSRIHNTSFS